MATNISTLDLTGLVPDELKAEIINKTNNKSTALQMAKVVPMTQPTKSFAVSLTKPGAYWVGEGEKIKVDKATFATVTLTAKKIGVIVPATRESLEDGVLNVLQEVKDQIAEAIAAELDKTVLFQSGTTFGVGKSIYELALAKGNKIVNSGHIFEDASNAMGLVEAAKLNANGFIAPNTVKAKIRNDKTASLNYIVEDKVNGEPAKMHGEAIVYAADGFDATKAELITGDFDKVYVGILDDLSYAISTEGTVDGINLFEQDMVAVRATMRVGFLVIKDDAFAYVDTTVIP